MEYNLQDHGDHLEKAFSSFIRTHFSTYELVWKKYIGNKGNDQKGDIDEYPFERNIKRQEFSEHTYTILQSIISLHRLIEKEVFSKEYLNTTNDILELQDNLLLFFTHLGRIYDNVEKASTCLLDLDVKSITKILDVFYHKRHILVHGKMVPIIFKSNGEIFLPVLSRDGVDISGWNHKSHSWLDLPGMQTEKVTSTVHQLYWELLPKLNGIFGEFEKKIEGELNSGSFKIKFEHQVFPRETRHGSGSLSIIGINVYGLANFDPKSW